MSDHNPVTVPDEFDDWPYEARSFVLAEANTVFDIHNAIADRVGFDRVEPVETDQAGRFTKDEMAELLMALGGPNE